MTNPDSYYRTLFELPVIIGTNLDPSIANPNDNVSKIIEQIIEKNIGATVVVQNKKPIGIVTERDIIEKVISKERDPTTTQIYKIMSSPVISVESNDSVEHAIEVLEKNNIRRLAVTENGILIGITTERRLLNIAHRTYLNNFEAKSITVAPFQDKLIISYLSSYPPRECGIATFTHDLVEAIDELDAISPPIITAMNDRGGFYNYPPQVKIQIEREELESYIEAAQKINNSSIQAINIQHEFGLFGGTWGDYLLNFLEEIEKPVITTLHTILEKPGKDTKRVMKGIIELSDRVVVLARIGSKILEEDYDTLSDKVRYIPHGGPNLPFIKSEPMKKVLGLNNRLIISNFGLISRGKGIEYAIRALPDIIKEEPNALFLVIGETHPEVRKHEGEAYRSSLVNLAESLGVEENVRFINKFLPKDDFIRYLQATDICILPYPNPNQISSGVLLYALCVGKAIVTTPFLHAQEVISQGAALDCEFNNPDSIAWAVNAFIKSNQLREIFEKRAYEYSRDMIWPNVAMRYVNLFYESIGI